MNLALFTPNLKIFLIVTLFLIYSVLCRSANRETTRIKGCTKYKIALDVRVDIILDIKSRFTFGKPNLL